jgi:hypothetical protein
MSTPEQPDTPQLTRKQLREIRNTGVTPIVTPEDLESGASDAPSAAQPVRPVEPPAPVVAPLPRAAEPLPIAEPPVADSSVDLGVSPLTRRQARQQERIRTASVPVITPEVAAAYGQSPEAQAAHAPHSPAAPAPAASVEPAPAPGPAAPSWWQSAVSPSPAAPADAVAASERAAEPDAAVDTLFAPRGADTGQHEARSAQPGASFGLPLRTEESVASSGERAVVSPAFGADLMLDDNRDTSLPASFDQLIAHSSAGSVSRPNALIVPHASGPSPIVAPVSATGDILVTGTLNLPEGLGSIGHAPGAADGKEVDAVLVDGELPAHSSPTPIAASAAVSTVKTAGDVIRPPVPEKGSKLMISLAITAGVLALALVGVLIVAIVTGVFQ